MSPTRYASAIALASVVAWSAAACGGTHNWTESAVAMEVEGIGMAGDKVGTAQWAGTGFWVDRQLLATNAHVATRAQRLSGVDDDGLRYHFSRIVALDREGDIAILRADRPAEKPEVRFYRKPDNPKDLRGREIVMVGNSGGLGLGFFFGRITNVLGEVGNEQVLHNASVVGGSSGSAIYDRETGTVVGIHHAGSAALDTKLATASWRIQEIVARARKAEGVDIGRLFTLENAGNFLNVWGERKFCVGPGESYKAVFNVGRATDIVTFVKPQSDAVFHAGLVRGEDQLIWKGAFKGTTVLPFSLPGGGTYAMVVLNPAGGPAQSCGVVGAGEIAWEKGIR